MKPEEGSRSATCSIHPFSLLLSLGQTNLERFIGSNLYSQQGPLDPRRRHPGDARSRGLRRCGEPVEDVHEALPVPGTARRAGWRPKVAEKRERAIWPTRRASCGGT